MKRKSPQIKNPCTHKELKRVSHLHKLWVSISSVSSSSFLSSTTSVSLCWFSRIYLTSFVSTSHSLHLCSIQHLFPPPFFLPPLCSFLFSSCVFPQLAEVLSFSSWYAREAVWVSLTRLGLFIRVVMIIRMCEDGGLTALKHIGWNWNLLNVATEMLTLTAARGSLTCPRLPRRDTFTVAHQPLAVTYACSIRGSKAHQCRRGHAFRRWNHVKVRLVKNGF